MGPRRNVARQGHAVRTPADRLIMAIRFEDDGTVAYVRPFGPSPACVRPPGRQDGAMTPVRNRDAT